MQKIAIAPTIPTGIFTYWDPGKGGVLYFGGVGLTSGFGEYLMFRHTHMAVCQNLVPLVNIKIAGKWMFIPLKKVSIGIDPYPYHVILLIYIMEQKNRRICAAQWLCARSSRC
jgi:hypothetical protein